MQFEYDYGSTWDPATHKYVPGATGVQGGGWNVDTYLDGIKNKITVTNNSNFPINATFSYANLDPSPFGTAPAGSYDVGGIFKTANNELKGIVTANNTDPASYGPESISLNMKTSDLDVGDKYYYQNSDDGVYIGNMFFSLLGTPARGLNMTTMQNVGTVTVTIDAATGAIEKTKS